jgi:ATP-dependent protease ClpP protease subunit
MMSRNAFIATTPTLLSIGGLKPSTSNTEELAKPSVSSSNNSGDIEQMHNKIFINGAISETSCYEIKRAIDTAANECRKLQNEYNLTEIPPIELHIQSNGGSLMPTFAVVDKILLSDVDVHSYVDGFAASAATLISVVCKKRFITKHSSMLLHQLSSGTQGKLSVMEEELQNLKLFNNMIKCIYLEHTKIDGNDIDELLKHDLWFDSNTCLQKGIVDVVL